MRKWQKKISQPQKTKLLCVWNKCNYKTQGGCSACKRNESADLGDENHHRSSYWKTLQRPKHQICNKPRETGKVRQEGLRGPHFWGDFCHWATSDPSPSPDRQGHATKWEKNRSSSRKRTTLRKDRFEPMEMEVSICKTGKIQMNIKMKTQEAHSKCPQEQSYLFEWNTAMLRDQQNFYEEPIV